MRLLGNPQNKIKVIHLAGTSGKGSTAHLTSQLLQSQGFKTGLFISPHLIDIRERLQINNKLLPEKLILKYFRKELKTHFPKRLTGLKRSILLNHRQNYWNAFIRSIHIVHTKRLFMAESFLVNSILKSPVKNAPGFENCWIKCWSWQERRNNCWRCLTWPMWKL